MTFYQMIKIIICILQAFKEESSCTQYRWYNMLQGIFITNKVSGERHTRDRYIWKQFSLFLNLGVLK